MSGSTLVIQSVSADMSGSPSLIILPGSLASGLVGHFYTNGSNAKSATNLAPGVAQAASVNGNPTFGTGFMNMQSGANYINSGIVETAAMTIIMAMRTDDPITTTDVYMASNTAADAGQGTGVVGTSLFAFHPQTPSSATIDVQTYFGATFASRTLSTLVRTAVNLTTWAVYAVTIQGASPFLVKLRNLTSGSSITLNGANPRQMNTVQAFQIGSKPGVAATGILQVASYSHWNRDLSDAECALMRTSVIAPYLLAKFAITV